MRKGRPSQSASAFPSAFLFSHIFGHCDCALGFLTRLSEPPHLHKQVSASTGKQMVASQGRVTSKPGNRIECIQPSGRALRPANGDLLNVLWEVGYLVNLADFYTSWSDMGARFAHSMASSRERTCLIRLPIRILVLAHAHVIEGPGPQRPCGRVCADDDTGGHSFRADEREFAWRGFVREETLPFAQQDWIDEYRRCVGQATDRSPGYAPRGSPLPRRDRDMAPSIRRMGSRRLHPGRREPELRRPARCVR